MNTPSGTAPSDTAPSTAGGLRARARRDITAAITRHAAEQIATAGVDALSLRAISRALGMAPSAVYRYFPDRDALLAALVVDAYRELGDAAQATLARSAGEAPSLRWLTACRAVRSWALTHRHRFALLYAIPPEERRPDAAIANRVGLTLVAIVADAARRGLLGPVTEPAPAAVHADAARLVETVGLAIPPERVPALLAAWSGLFGLVAFEVFGQLEGIVTARAEFFDRSVRVLAQNVGIRG